MSLLMNVPRNRAADLGRILVDAAEGVRHSSAPLSRPSVCCRPRRRTGVSPPQTSACRATGAVTAWSTGRDNRFPGENDAPRPRGNGFPLRPCARPMNRWSCYAGVGNDGSDESSAELVSQAHGIRPL
jgi:hypothetical protein